MPKAILVVDLGYGDSGKGTIIDFLAKDLSAHTVVRFNGGAQAAHNVVLPNGKYHTFAQFGSGTLQGASTFLFRYVLVDPETFFVEGEHLREMGITNAYSTVQVDSKCLVVTPFHKAANRLLERARGEMKHGSCGMGIGEAMSDMLSGSTIIRAEDLTKPRLLAAKLEAIRMRKYEQVRSAMDTLGDRIGEEGEILKNPDYCKTILETFKIFGEMVAVVDSTYLSDVLSAGTTLFEGAQGVLLDEWYGFHPYTTWSTTTFENADRLLSEAGFTGEVTRLGILRAYQTRHGPGPFVTEDKDLTSQIPDHHNTFGQWQGEFRVGHLDLVATRYALDAVGGVDGLVVTNIDRLSVRPEWLTCSSYEYAGLADVSELFQGKDNIVTGINTGPYRDLQYQERLTSALMDCEPRYDQVSPSLSDKTNDREGKLLKTIEETLERPIILTSHGPTVGDKRLRSDRFLQVGQHA